MKKVTFILLAFIGATAFAQNSANGTTEVLAEIVQPISIKGVAALNFGKIAVGTDAAGAVRVSEDGLRTFSDPDMEIPTGEVSAASFAVNVPKDITFSVSIPSTTLSLGDDSMNLSFTHNLEDTGNNGSDQDIELKVGGVLQVGADQTEGKYEGIATVTVSYE